MPGTLEKSTAERDGNIYSKLITDSSLKLKTVILIAAVVVSALTVFFVLHAETDNSSAEVTESGWCGENAYYYIYSDGTLKIEGSGAMYDYNGLQRAPWYDHREDITKVIIGDNITYLGQWAFVKCKHVTELTMPITLNSVSSDLSSAFAGCYNIEKIHFTCGKDGYGYDYAAYRGYDSWYQNTPWFQSKDTLKEITFADGIKHIGSDAFRELNITKVVLPESVTSLGCHCFFDCTKITDLTIPVSLNSYGNENYPAFQGCMAVKNITITRGNGVPFDYSNWRGSMDNVNLAPWNMNSNVAKFVTIADNVTSLGKFMFFGCCLKELTIPISVVQDDSHRAFQTPYYSLEKVTITKGSGRGCDYAPSFSYQYNPWNSAMNLQTLVLEEGVTHIGDSMFYWCSADKIVLPDSLVSLGRNSFEYCRVTELVIPISLNTVWLDTSPAFENARGLEKITFTAGSGYGFDYAAYYGSNSWYQYTPWYQCRSTLKEIVFEDGIKSLGSDAFRELNITSVTIPDSVVSLGNHTFYHCDKLTNLTVPITLDCVHSALYPAFDQCLSITTLRFTAGSNGIGVDYTDCVPAWCTPLHRASKISFDSGIVYVGEHTFEGYTFYGTDGNYLEPTAENLSGHVFAGISGALQRVDKSDLTEETVLVLGHDIRFSCIRITFTCPDSKYL